jgi:hypothetical protein
MAYVPQCSADVFVSYAHADDASQASWVEALVNELEREVRKRLGAGIGSEARIWRDTERLRVGDNWPDALNDAVKGAATFLAVVSPNYMASRVCAEERRTFLDTFDADKDTALRLLVDSKRFLKLIRLPPANNVTILDTVQHLDFYQRDRSGIDVEFGPMSDEFRRGVVACATALRDTLQAMRRRREKVFVAWPAGDGQADWQTVQKEFKAHGYDVQPDSPIDEFLADGQVQDSMRDARVSIHLLGGEYVPATERQIRLAAALNLRLFFWVSPQCAATTDERQRLLVQRLSNGSVDGKIELPAGWTLVQSASLPTLCEDVRTALKQPTVAPVTRRADAKASIYLLCDPTTDLDATFAKRLGDQIQTQEDLAVVLPPTNPDDRKLRHQASLRECDGVLVYSDSAPRDWLRFAVEDVTHAEAAIQREPLRSKALLTPDTAPWRSYPIRLIPRKLEFTLNDLEPFLAPLRVTAGPAARV